MRSARHEQARFAWLSPPKMAKEIGVTPENRTAGNDSLAEYLANLEKDGKILPKRRPQSAEYKQALYTMDYDSPAFKAVAHRELRLSEEWAEERAFRVLHWTKQWVRRNARLAKSELLTALDRELCEVCGWEPLTALESARPIVQLHHIVAVAHGGTNEPNNLVVLCPNCHIIAHRIMSKGSQPTGREAFLSAMQNVLKP